MQIGRIRDSNHVFHPPQDQPQCQPLHVRVTHEYGEICSTSAWLPTPEEVELIKAGQPVYLHVYGGGHPMVYLSVAKD